MPLVVASRQRPQCKSVPHFLCIQHKEVIIDYETIINHHQPLSTTFDHYQPLLSTEQARKKWCVSMFRRIDLGLTFLCHLWQATAAACQDLDVESMYSWQVALELLV